MRFLSKVFSVFILTTSYMPAFAIEWKDCRIGTSKAAHTIEGSCATFKVPENRSADSHNGRTIDLNLALMWSYNKNRQADPILFLAGGPGQSAIESYVQIQAGFRPLIKERNIYLVDQRGTGKSNPLNCNVNPEQLRTTPSDEDIAIMFRQCLKALDADTRYYTTTESIEDLEALRKSLNIKQWNLVGVSYGTRKALTYAKMYPNAIRTMVLDGVVPQQESLGEKHEENLLQALKLQFEECKKQPACNKAFGNVEATMNELLQQADTKPLVVTVPHPVTGAATELILSREVLTMVVRMFAYSADTYKLIPLLLHMAKNGQPENIASQALIIFEALSDSITIGMDLSVNCAEDAPFFPEHSTTQAFFGKEPMAVLRKKQCALWPHIKAASEFKQPVESNIPTLLLSGEFDPVTPPKFADITAQTLTNSQHLVAKGFGHGVFMRGCMPYIVRDFIDSPSTPLDTDCMSNFATPPFYINLMGPKQ